MVFRNPFSILLFNITNAIVLALFNQFCNDAVPLIKKKKLYGPDNLTTNRPGSVFSKYFFFKSQFS